MKPQMDLTQIVFFDREIHQPSYDREIDEGVSSGLKRYVTLDVTALNAQQTVSLLEQIVAAGEGFNHCKFVQVVGFNRNEDGKRYIAVSGESHYSYQRDAAHLMLKAVKRTIGSLPVQIVENFIPLPSTAQPYAPLNLGAYGTTGRPISKIPMHPDATGLRVNGKIR